MQSVRKRALAGAFIAALVILTSPRRAQSTNNTPNVVISDDTGANPPAQTDSTLQWGFPAPTAPNYKRLDAINPNNGPAGFRALSTGGTTSLLELVGSSSTASEGTVAGIVYGIRNDDGQPLGAIKFVTGQDPDSGTMSFEVLDELVPLEAMRIDSNGWVGIGTTSPGTRLDVQENAPNNTALNAETTATSGSNYAASFEAETSSSGTNYAIYARATGGAQGNYAIYSQTGVNYFGYRVGVGTDPSASMHVREPTLGNEVFRAESVATNDDPNYRLIQCRQTNTGAGSSSPLKNAVFERS